MNTQNTCKRIFATLFAFLFFPLVQAQINHNAMPVFVIPALSEVEGGELVLNGPANMPNWHVDSFFDHFRIFTNSGIMGLQINGSTGAFSANRFEGANALALSSFRTVQPASNVYLYSPLNDRDAWIYLDKADPNSNWGIYHRQIDAPVEGIPANAIGFVGGGNSQLNAYIALTDGSAYFGGKVGIGTAHPDAKLTLQGDGSAPLLLNVGGDSNGKIRVRHIDGKQADSAQLDHLYLQHGVNYNTYIGIGGTGNVSIGTSSADYKLNVAGAVRAKEVIVDSGWADYVFADYYSLSSLDEVETHIKQNKHLPGIPSAKEVAEKGVSVGEMQALLLSKIEELTLYQIDLHKNQKEQNQRIKELETENRNLKEILKSR